MDDIQRIFTVFGHDHAVALLLHQKLDRNDDAGLVIYN